MRKQMEILKDHPNLFSLMRQGGVTLSPGPPVTLVSAEHLTANADLAR
jgi:hypothetical protein